MLHSSSTEGSASADPHSLPLESFKAVLDMTALALEPERFTDAGSAVVTALASRLACDRVSLGMASRNRVRVRALSHNAEFNHKTDLFECDYCIHGGSVGSTAHGFVACAGRLAVAMYPRA